MDGRKGPLPQSKVRRIVTNYFTLGVNPFILETKCHPGTLFIHELLLDHLEVDLIVIFFQRGV